MAQELISVYQVNKGLIRDYAEGEPKAWGKALIQPGQAKVDIKLERLSEAEVGLILTKLDMLAINRQNPTIAAILAEEADSVLTAVRMVKTETKESFAGILGGGANLDICWIRAKDVGGELTDQNGVASKGAYALGAGGAVYSWLKTNFVAGTNVDMFPSAKLIEEAGIIFLGAIDPIEVPKVEAIQFTIAGILCPPQSLGFRQNNQEFGAPAKLSVARLEKPVIIGPEKTFTVTVNPSMAGSGKCEPLALLITTAEKMSLT